MQLADAQRKHAAAMDAKGGAEFKAKREGALCKQAEWRAVSSEKAKSKSDTALEKAQAKNARLRQLKNDSNKRAREAEKKSSRMQRTYENKTAQMEHLQEQLDSQKAETATLALEVEDKAEEVQGLEQPVADLEALQYKESLAEYERLKESRACDRPKVALWRKLGMRGGRYSQDVVELGQELMSKDLTAEQAVSVVCTFAHFEYPDKEENRGYRIPDASRFREWRTVPELIAHCMAVSLVGCSDHYHPAHDASTKGKLVHICQTAVTCVLKVIEGKEEVVTAPLKFEICPSGTAAAEAQLTKDALHCDVDRGQHATLPTAKSACSDHAALGTTDAIEVLKKE